MLEHLVEGKNIKLEHINESACLIIHIKLKELQIRNLESKYYVTYIGIMLATISCTSDFRSSRNGCCKQSS
jgi:hypothetical protein